MQRKNGSFDLHHGIFIDPAMPPTDGGVWSLRNGAIVLDEMNRADLDRCIGELYRLLSGTVDQVAPAGLPDVKSIRNSERFRVLATVNDARLDDIVFPISEGLARRFQRIELPGASRKDVASFLHLDGSEEEMHPRQLQGKAAIAAFFDAARTCKLFKPDPGASDETLPVGVAYFAPLKAWVDGKLKLGADATDAEQARNVLIGCFSSLRRAKAWATLLENLAPTK